MERLRGATEGSAEKTLIKGEKNLGLLLRTRRRWSWIAIFFLFQLYDKFLFEFWVTLLKMSINANYLNYKAIIFDKKLHGWYPILMKPNAYLFVLFCFVYFFYFFFKENAYLLIAGNMFPYLFRYNWFHPDWRHIISDEAKNLSLGGPSIKIFVYKI